MSVKERERLKIFARVNGGELQHKEAAALCHLEYRYLRQLYKRYCQQVLNELLDEDAADKLVPILVGLESIILKDSNEPIMNNIGERMAALIGHGPASRKSIKNKIEN